jgi:hypothetical protein
MIVLKSKKVGNHVRVYFIVRDVYREVKGSCMEGTYHHLYKHASCNGFGIPLKMMFVKSQLFFCVWCERSGNDSVANLTSQVGSVKAVKLGM